MTSQGRRPAARRPPTTWPSGCRAWVGLGLISRAQADRILAVERGEPVAPPRRPASMLAEALGYVGGVLILVATAVLVGRFWADLGVTGRLVVTFGAVVLLIGVGAVVPTAGPAAGGCGRCSGCSRWRCSGSARGCSPTTSGTSTRRPCCSSRPARRRWSRPCCGGGTARRCSRPASSPRWWWWPPRPPRTCRTTTATLIGLAIWGVGVVWLLLGWGGVVGPRLAADVLGGVVVVGRHDVRRRPGVGERAGDRDGGGAGRGRGRRCATWRCWSWARSRCWSTSRS